VKMPTDNLLTIPAAELTGVVASKPSLVTQLKQGMLTPQAITSLLYQYGLLPKLLQELLIDQSIADISYDSLALQDASQGFYTANGITSAAELTAWTERHDLTADRLQEQLQRSLRLDIYKQQTWGHRLESHFLAHKAQLDQVTYSLLRIQDFAMAQEIFFRIQSGEQSFADAVREYSQGAEVETDGVIGPTSLSQPHPLLAARLKSAQVGQVLPPVKVGDWAVVLRLEQYLPAQFDTSTQQKLLEHLYQSWLQESVQKLMADFLVNPDLIAVPEAV
jgi:parvulin-like peptidyl-prolyl isomerase